MTNIYWMIKKQYLQNSEQMRKCALINVHRVYLASVLAMLVNLTSIGLFIAMRSINHPWSNPMIVLHCILFVLMAICFFIARSVKDNTKLGAMVYIIPYIVMISIFVISVSIAAIDQLLTSSSITAYIIACMISGIVFLIRPLHSIIVFAAGYGVYFFFLQMITPNVEILMGYSINGLTAAMIGLVLSFIMWRNHQIDSKQKEHIQKQKLALEKANKELREIAYLDPLTGLPNRRHFDNVIREETFYTRESCLIMIDFDHFKSINDAHGHPAGDKVLMQTSKLLKKNIRKDDIICRLGGDEFLLLLPQTNLSEAKKVAEKLRKLIEEHVFHLGSQTVTITASFGVSRLICANNDSLINYYSSVDKALYCAKQKHGNCVEDQTNLS